MKTDNLEKASDLHKRRVKLNRALKAVERMTKGEGKDDQGDALVGDINNFNFVEYTN